MADAQGYIYKSVVNSQVLQRDPKTNAASVLVNGEPVEYKAGGPYSIGSAHDVYVGDVWIMAGQSNMRGHGFQIDPFSNRKLTLNAMKTVHLFNSSEEWTLAKDPIHHLASSPRKVHHTLPDPTVSNPEILEYRGASLGLSFAKKYQQLNHNIPVGLVASAHGGTSLEDWKRPEDFFSSKDDLFSTTLYGAMLGRIKKVGPIAGILWYQGESDTSTETEAITYKDRFRRWLDVLRLDLGKDDLPVAFVQIGSHRIDDNPEMIKNWRIVQNGQRELFGYSAFTAGVTSFDSSLDDRLHLSAVGLNKVGERLAIAATEAKRGFSRKATPLPLRAFFEWSSISAVQKTGAPSSIVVEFEQVLDEYVSTGWKNDVDQEIYGFEIESLDKKVALLNTRINDIDQRSIRLYLTAKPNAPVYVKYGMNQMLKGNLVRADGMAVPAFQGLEVLNSVSMNYN